MKDAICVRMYLSGRRCRFPGRAHGSLEANGIFVSELAAMAQVKYNNGANTVTYFGALICNSEDLKMLENLEVK